MAEGLRGELEYNTDLFERGTIQRTLRHFQTLLEGVTADPGQRIGELPLLTEAERHQLLVEWNDTRTDYPRERCIHELFEAQAARTPESVALEFEGQEIIYAELNRRANQLARVLRKRGVGPDVSCWGICRSLLRDGSGACWRCSKRAEPMCRLIPPIQPNACDTCWRMRELPWCWPSRT